MKRDLLKSYGNMLARLGGADPSVLEKAPSAKSRFTPIGVSVLVTSGFASVSMWLAFETGLSVAWWLAAPLAILWGLINLTIDRVLLQHRWWSGGFSRRLAAAAPRILLALVLGFVVSTPLVLRVFRSEIAPEVAAMNASALTKLNNELATGPTAKQLTAVEQQIAVDQKILGGVLPGLISPAIQAAQARLSHAQSDQATQQARADVAYKAMICELTGTKCQGSSGVPGSGIRYEALRRNYLLATAELQAAKKEVADAQTALDTAYAGAAKANADVVRQAQDQARKELPGLFASRDQLQELLNRQAASGARELANNTGILAQLTALDRLDHRSNSARLAHWLVVLLIIMIQILPVLMKFLTSMGPPTLYDRIQEADDRVAYEDATSGHEATSRQVAIDSMIRNSVVEAVYGPPLANYDGWINVEIHRPATVDVTDEERRIIIESPGEFDLTVTISTDRVSPIAEPLVVSNGVDLPKVEFTVMVDSELAALRQAPITVTVDSSLPSGVARFTLNPRAGDGTPWLWVRVSQGRRTLQNIELSLDVAPQSIESSRDVAPVREPS